ncbi:MAG: PAS domain S-box protein, partial [Methanospirillum sp.]|nr:PAS domain S-box protein [Methanospirillum sp.]
MVDSSGKFLDVNSSVSSMFEYSHEELLSHSISDLLYDECRSNTITDFISLQNQGPFQCESIIYKKNGEKLPVLINAVQLPDHTVLCFCADISDRKREEQERERLIIELGASNEQLSASYEELTASEEELRHQYTSLVTTEEHLRQTKDYLDTLIANANVPIIVWDSSYNIVRLNHAFELLIGRTWDEVIETSLESLFPPNQAERSMRLIQTTQDGVRWQTVEMDVLHQDGSLRTILWNSSTLYNPDGFTPIATIAQGQDVTVERRLEQEKNAAIAQIQQNLAQLAILNDEIRNPLTIISLCSDSIDNHEITDQIIDQIHRIDNLVTQLDQRWIESEKVLNFMRKHYLIQPIQGFEKDNRQDSEIRDQKESILIKSQIKKTDVLVEEVQAQLYTILDSIDALIYVSDMDTHELLFINRQGRSVYGYGIGQKCHLIIHQNPTGPCSFCTNHLLVDNNGSRGVFQREFQNQYTGRWYDCRDRAIRWSDGRLVRLEIATDITDRKQVEEKIGYITRMYAMFSQIDQAIVRTRDCNELFLKICQIAIEFGKFHMAWVGLFDPVEGRIKPVAHAGHEDGYLDQIRITTGDTPLGRGPTGIAFLEGKIMTSSDIATDPCMAPWKDEALKRGYRSSAAVPIKQKGKSIGAFMLYATEPEFFTEEERELLEQIGEDISFALDSIAIETEHLQTLVALKKTEEMCGNLPYLKQTEEALRLSEGHLNTLVQTIPDLVWLKDIHGVFLSCNTMFERLFGAKESDIIGKTDYDFVSQELADFFRENDKKAMNSGEPWRNEEWVTFADDGHRALLDTIKTPMYDNQGTLIGVLGIGRDITERKQIERELLSAQADLKEVHHLAHIGTWDWIFQTDTTTWSEELYDISGIDPSVPAPPYAEQHRFYTPRSWLQLKTAISLAFSSGESYNLELEFIRTDGITIWTHIYGAVKRDPNGEIIGLHGTVQDINERKKMEEALLESNKKLRLLTSLTRHDIFNQLSAVDLLHNLALQSSEIDKIFD